MYLHLSLPHTCGGVMVRVIIYLPYQSETAVPQREAEARGASLKLAALAVKRQAE